MLVPLQLVAVRLRVRRFGLEHHRAGHLVSRYVSHAHREQRDENVKRRVGGRQGLAVKPVHEQIRHRRQPRTPIPWLREPEKRRDKQRLKPAQPCPADALAINGRGNRRRPGVKIRLLFNAAAGVNSDGQDQHQKRHDDGEVKDMQSPYRQVVLRSAPGCVAAERSSFWSIKN